MRIKIYRYMKLMDMSMQSCSIINPANNAQIQVVVQERCYQEKQLHKALHASWASHKNSKNNKILFLARYLSQISKLKSLFSVSVNIRNLKKYIHFQINKQNINKDDILTRFQLSYSQTGQNAN